MKSKIAHFFQMINIFYDFDFFYEICRMGKTFWGFFHTFELSIYNFWHKRIIAQNLFKIIAATLMLKFAISFDSNLLI